MSALAEFIFRRARSVMIATAIFALVAGAVGSSITDALESGGFEDPGAESGQALDAITQATGTDPQPGVVAVLSTTPHAAQSQTGHDRVAAAIRTIRREELVNKVDSLLNDNNPAFVSNDGTKTYLVAFFAPSSVNEARQAARRIADRLNSNPNIRAGGPILNETQIDDQVALDLQRVELIALPVLLLLSFLVFRGLVAASLPVLIAAFAVTGAFLAMRVLTEIVPLSVFSLNLVTGLGLGLAIDYALFIVSRYREEIAIDGPGLAALQRTMATAGRTVVFSGCTVAVALLSLLVFPQRFLYSMGVGGSIVTLSAVIAALVSLPAALVLLGDRVNSLAPRRLQRSRRKAEVAPEASGWYRLAKFVIGRPIGVATIVALILLGFTFPALRANFMQGDRHVLPANYSARQVTDSLDREFAVDATAPLVATVRGPASAHGQMVRYANQLKAMPDVADVMPPVLLATNLWRIDIATQENSMTTSTQNLVRAVRDRDAPGAQLVTGEAAVLYDANQTLESRLPIAVALLTLTTLVALFLMTGSILLPLKTLVMNLLTLSATFGLLVLVFQDGNLEGLFGFSASGTLEQTNMVLLAIVVFGLSTDYGVFLLARIKEAHDSGLSNSEAIAVGLARTGRVVSAAALLFCVAVGTLVTSAIVIVKTIGLGAAIAVLIDATLIRALLVPALMVLLGRYNWWAPAPLHALHTRFNLAESSRSGTPATSIPSSPPAR
jgi:RND superfamily putative drug exporter